MQGFSKGPLAALQGVSSVPWCHFSFLAMCFSVSCLQGRTSCSVNSLHKFSNELRQSACAGVHPLALLFRVRQEFAEI